MESILLVKITPKAKNVLRSGDSSIVIRVEDLDIYYSRTNVRLDFEATTGSGLINAKIQASVQHDTSDDVLVKLYLNNVQVMGDLITSAPTEVLFFDPFRLLIPPNTTVRITADNEGSTSTLPIYITITGKVNG